MERSFSVDDLVGGIWRLGQAGAMGGMGRTDSETALHEFLNRIPSVSNLSAVAASGQLPAVDQLQNTLPSSGSLATKAEPLSPGGENGIQRVPSLDLIRQLMTNQTVSQALSQQASKPDVPTATASMGIGPLSSFDLTTFGGTTGLQTALSGLPSLSSSGPSLASLASLTPQLQAAQQAAAAMQHMHQLQTLRGLQQASAPVALQQQLDSKAEPGSGGEKDSQRRQRRMLSNRESARRSRKRKQETMASLEAEVNRLKEVQAGLLDKVALQERRASSAEDEVRRLREENGRLREELQYMRSEMSDRKAAANGHSGHKREAENGQAAPPAPPARREAKRAAVE